MSSCLRARQFFQSRRQGLCSVDSEALFSCRLQVPTIAVLGSGGGYRATTGFSAACHALEEMDLLDCVTYMTGLSGSAW